MDAEDRGALGPYIKFDGLPPLHAREKDLPLLHPYGAITSGRYITPGGGRLTLEQTSTHHRVTLDHLGCDAQITQDKTAAFEQIALAAEARCLVNGCSHPARFSTTGPYRMFEVPKGAVEVSAFVRMILAVELGDTRPGEAFAMAAEAAVKAGQQYVLRQVRQAGS